MLHGVSDVRINNLTPMSLNSESIAKVVPTRQVPPYINTGRSWIGVATLTRGIVEGCISERENPTSFLIGHDTLQPWRWIGDRAIGATLDPLSHQTPLARACERASAHTRSTAIGESEKVD